MKIVLRQSFQSLAMNGAQVLFAFLGSIIIARALGPTERGVYVLFVLIGGTAAMLCNPGIYASANYYLSTNRWSIREAMGTVILASLVMGLLAGAVSVLTVVFGGIAPTLAQDRNLLLALAIYAVVVVMANSLSGLFFGARKIGLITTWKMVFSVVQFLVFLLMSFRAADAKWYSIAFVALSVIDVVALFVLFQGLRELDLRTNKKLLLEMVRYGLPVHGSRVLLYAGQRLDTFMVLFLAGVVALSHYTIAVALAEQLWILPVSVSMIMMPNLGRLAMREAVDMTATVLRYASVLVIAATLVLAIIMPWLLPLMYGAEYTSAVIPFLLLLPGTAVVSLYNIVEPFFQSRGRPGLPLLITMVGVLANLVLNLLVIPTYGMVGAAVASSVAYIVQFAVMCVVFVRLSKRSLFSLAFGERLRLLGTHGKYES